MSLQLIPIGMYNEIIYIALHYIYYNMFSQKP